MAFVKLDCGILNSTLWVERESRDIFITVLLMAQPFEVKEPMEQLEVGEIKPTGFVVPPGWYGFVEAAGPGIVRRALADMKDGMEALRKLGEPDSESRSSEFDGRRLVRVNGGYIVLNYMKYRDKDATSAVRSARYRERKKMAELSRDSVAVTRDSSRGVTIAEAEAEAEAEEEKHTPQPPRGSARKRAPDLRPEDVAEQVWADWCALRKSKKAAVTATALEGIRREARRAGLTMQQALETCCANGWQGLKAEWLTGKNGQPMNEAQRIAQRDEKIARLKERLSDIED